MSRCAASARRRWRRRRRRRRRVQRVRLDRQLAVVPARRRSRRACARRVRGRASPSGGFGELRHAAARRFLTLFVVTTLHGWAKPLWRVQRVTNAEGCRSRSFSVVILVGSYLIINLLIAEMLTRFQASHAELGERDAPVLQAAAQQEKPRARARRGAHLGDPRPEDRPRRQILLETASTDDEPMPARGASPTSRAGCAPTRSPRAATPRRRRRRRGARTSTRGRSSRACALGGGDARAVVMPVQALLVRTWLCAGFAPTWGVARTCARGSRTTSRRSGAACTRRSCST